MTRPTPTSLRLDTAPAPKRAPLDRDLEVDERYARLEAWAGERFDAQGRVVEGPAIEDRKRRPAPARPRARSG